MRDLFSAVGFAIVLCAIFIMYDYHSKYHTNPKQTFIMYLQGK